MRSGGRGTTWGWGHSPGALVRQRPKTPLTAVIPWALVRVFFSCARRGVKATVNLELYLRKI